MVFFCFWKHYINHETGPEKNLQMKYDFVVYYISYIE